MPLGILGVEILQLFSWSTPFHSTEILPSFSLAKIKSFGKWIRYCFSHSIITVLLSLCFPFIMPFPQNEPERLKYTLYQWVYHVLFFLLSYSFTVEYIFAGRICLPLQHRHQIRKVIEVQQWRLATGAAELFTETSIWKQWFRFWLPRRPDETCFIALLETMNSALLSSTSWRWLESANFAFEIWTITWKSTGSTWSNALATRWTASSFFRSGER